MEMNSNVIKLRFTHAMLRGTKVLCLVIAALLTPAYIAFMTVAYFPAGIFAITVWVLTGELYDIYKIKPFRLFDWTRSWFDKKIKTNANKIPPCWKCKFFDSVVSDEDIRLMEQVPDKFRCCWCSRADMYVPSYDGKTRVKCFVCKQ